LANLLLAHGADDGDQEVLAIIKAGLNLTAQIALGDLHVVLRDALLGHEVEEAFVDVNLCRYRSGIFSCIRGKTHELVLVTGDVGDVHVVGGRGDIFLRGHQPQSRIWQKERRTSFLPVKIYSASQGKVSTRGEVSQKKRGLTSMATR
jgi:hypothetical protein